MPHVVEQIGAVAGLAAVIGLAILSALYFSQARDLRRLREWAGRAPERAADGQAAGPVPGRVVAVAQRPQPAQPGAPAPTSAPAPATPAGAAPANGEAKPAEEGDAKPEEAAATATRRAAAARRVAARGGVVAARVSRGEGDEPEDGEARGAKPGMPAPASA